MPNSVYIATSLDGFIARRDGNLEWLTELPNPENSDYGFSLFMEGMDGIVMGRKTFETVAGFGQWPYEKPVFVLSTRWKGLPDGYRGKATLVKGTPETVVETLNKQGFRNLYIDGGKTIQGFLQRDLIDELVITRIPILLGSGIPLFGEMELELRFTHLRTEILGGQLVKSTYQRTGSSD